jgi:hypothetical protein
LNNFQFAQYRNEIEHLTEYYQNVQLKSLQENIEKSSSDVVKGFEAPVHGHRR